VARPTPIAIEGRNPMQLSQIENISFPCIWFCGPLKNDRVLFGCSVIRKKWHLRFTPFWPDPTSYVPGGLLDCKGRYIKFEKLVGWKTMPPKLSPMLGAIVFNFRRIFVKFDVLVSEPQHLSFENFKQKVYEIADLDSESRSTKLGQKNLNKFNDTKTYLEVTEFVYWYQMSDGGTVN
jgi:hypothetical protein